MTTATRQLKIQGYLETETASAIIAINGVEVFNGVVGVGHTGPMPPSEIVDLATFTFEGQTTPNQEIHVAITVTSGSAAFASLFVNRNSDPLGEPTWRYPASETDDGRTNILVNGVEPQWPSDGGPTVPGGTPENPIWIGWAFRLLDGGTLEYDYLCLAFLAPPPQEV